MFGLVEKFTLWLWAVVCLPVNLQKIIDLERTDQELLRQLLRRLTRVNAAVSDLPEIKQLLITCKTYIEELHRDFNARKDDGR